MVDKKRNGSIDFFRVIAAAAIIMIHFSGQFKPYAIFESSFGKMGVPFFFLVTGYFYFNNTRRLHYFDLRQVFNYEKKMLILWLVWSLVSFYRIFISNFSIPLLLRSLWGLNFFSGPLWYLIAACEGLIIVQYIWVKFGRNFFLILFFISFVMCLLGSNYGGLLNRWPQFQKIYFFVAPQTSFFAAIVWFGVSIFMVYHKDELYKCGRIFPLLVGILLWLCEYVFVHLTKLSIDTDMYIMLVPVSVIFFFWLLNHPIYLSDKADRFLRDLSLYMYVSQVSAGDVVAYLIGASGIKHLQTGPFFYLIVLLVDLVISIIMVVILHSEFISRLNLRFTRASK